MAVVNNFNQNQDDNQNQQGQNPNVSAPISVSGSSAPNASAPSAAPTVQAAPSSSGRFQNLQSYLTANKDYNKEGGGLAGQLNNTLQGQEQRQEQGIQSAQQGWVDANKAKDYDINKSQDEINYAVSNPNAYLGQQTVPSTVSNPNRTTYLDSGSQAPVSNVPGAIPATVQNTSDPSVSYYTPPAAVNEQDQIGSFQKYLNAANTFQAPEQFDASQQVAGDVNAYQTNANLAQNEAGRQTLLRNLYGNPNYSSGQQKLDNLLLQADPSQLGALDASQGYAQNLKNAYAGAMSNTQDTSNQYKSHAQAVQDASRAALGGAFTNFDTQAKNSITDTIKARDAAYGASRDNLKAGQITGDDLAKFGLQDNLSLFGIDPSQYLHKVSTNPTQQNIITKDQQSYVDALGKLAGQGVLSGDPAQLMSQYVGNTQAGTFDTNPYNFDKDAFMRDVIARPTQKNVDFTNYVNSNPYLANDPSFDRSNPQAYINQLNTRRDKDTTDLNSIFGNFDQLSPQQQEASLRSGQGGQRYFDDRAKNIDAANALKGILSKYGIDANGNTNTLKTVSKAKIKPPQEGQGQI